VAERLKARDEIREAVRERYATAAKAAESGSAACCAPGGSGCGCGTDAIDGEESDVFGATLYAADDRDALPDAARLASLGCGNPTAVAELREGETVLDLGSGGGIDMTDEMLELARENQRQAGVENAEFLKGTIEEVPLADESVDVIVSNCVINLSADKPSVFRAASRVLRPGGRFAVTDVIADPDMDEETRRDMAQWTGCVAGALTADEFRRGLEAVGLENVEIVETHRVHEHAGSAIVRARKPD
jgi:SAM-dependent methyltransferase